MKNSDYRRGTSDAVAYNSEDELHTRLRLILEGFITPQKVFYTRKEAGEILRCGKTKTFELIRQNKLEKVKQGARTLVTKSSVDALIAKMMMEGGHAA
jgi:excisionase family DNA binding protein